MFVEVCRKIYRYSVDSPGATIIFAFNLSFRNHEEQTTLTDGHSLIKEG